MDNQSKAKINLKEGTIELEGSEQFVSKYLDEFKKGITTQTTQDHVVKNQSIPINPKKEKEISKPSAKIKTKNIKPEDFDIKATNDKPSLQEFLGQKKPSETVAHRIAVIGYYITKIKGLNSFSEGNIEFAYKILPLNKRPVHLHQACIDAKNRNHYLEEVEGENGKWRVSRIGEIFVEDKLPPQDLKNAI